jgi:hypothetical protein
MKLYLNIAKLLFVLAIISSCTNYETISEPKVFNLKADFTSADSIKIMQNQGAGSYKELIPNDNLYVIDIPAMRGGYSSVLGFKYNVSNPDEYTVIKLVKGSNILKELSTIQLEGLQKDENGNYLLKY